MADQTYALAQDGVYGQANGAYTNALDAISDSETVIEDFERTDPLSDYDGDLDRVGVDESDPIEGDKSIRRSADNDNTGFVRTTSLEPVTNDSEFSFLIYPRNSDSSAAGLFGVPSGTGGSGSEDGYSVFLDARDEKTILREFSNGSATTLDDDTSAGITGGQPYEVAVVWDGSSIDVSIYEFDLDEFERGGQVTTLSATDSTHSNETGIAWRLGGRTGQDSSADYFVISEGN